MITVTLTKVLDSMWILPEEEADTSDEDIIALVCEDLLELIEGAVWEIKRS